jgi:hypothetical protein
MRPVARIRRCLTCVALLAIGWLAASARSSEPTVPDLPALGEIISAQLSSDADGSVPSLLDRPLESSPLAVPVPAADPYAPSPPFVIDHDPPSGYTGRSSVDPRTVQTNGHFVPVEDRWRVGVPSWDRYDKGHPPVDDYPIDVGQWWDPYHQNVLKGDYPIIGQNTFLELTGTLRTVLDARQLPLATTPFESTKNPGQFEFFGKPNNVFLQDFLSLSIDLFHGDGAFKPVDWRILVTPTFNVNNLAVEEVAIVSPDVRKGTTRNRSFFALQEYFVEKKIADLSPNYDFLSVRAGSQFFVSDFRGFIFSDTNRAVRLFGNLEANRDQFNLIYFNQQEKDTNSFLNTFSNRHQQILIGNFYRQDFIWPGYTAQASVHYNHDDPSFKFDKNGFLVRPDPVGVFQPHGLDVAYLGLTGDGHINRFNITNAFYYAFGHDTQNPLANCPQDISAYFAAVELSYDRDYVRFRVSGLYSSGDGNPNNGHATGFDSILDRQNFAGTQFSYFGRQKIMLFGVGLVQENSLIPDLRSSKNQGQSNFVNPGLELLNLGIDIDLTPKLKSINNCNFMWFDKTASLETFVFQGNIDRFIGVDLSSGMEYRPFLSNNVILQAGVATLLPGKGFSDLFDRLNHGVPAFVAAFAQMQLTF